MIYSLTTNDYSPTTLLVTTDIQRVKKYNFKEWEREQRVEDGYWVEVWENNNELDSLRFTDFIEKY